MNSALKWMPLVAVIALATAGCARDGFYHDRNLDYGEAEETAPLVLPDGRDAERYRDAMPVPEVSGTRPAEDGVVEAPLPQALSPGRSMERGYVERRAVGDERWLVVGAEPATVWPELERFVRSRGLTVTASDSRRGILETDQARLSVRPALRSGDSEIRCEQGGTTQAACLTALERHFEGVSASSSAASLAAQRPDAQNPARFEQRGDDWQVILPFAADRLWAELSHQLELDFAVEGRRELLERDPAARSFLVGYLTQSERERGLLQSLATLNLGESTRQVRLVLEARGPEETVLKAQGAGEEALSTEDQRELLERVAGLLR
ncbi:outer membrane protein assembly factor BamC [Halomonas sp. LR5S13]|uniref:outer membrane protein assembly factor BamC n=1 Tax=Halomonas rhizosphaerae TaxID=3043296 RepID=UPI0024A96BA5|nr:outer membrane protein assembly factor BamC [Halomonas rhizosphaerae]MDI5919878.1 outer membrane protein assembly factor BamC [Halomonas rhizosphaerae]